MAIMLSKTYDAFCAAGAPEDKAREAAEKSGEEIAALDRRLIRLGIICSLGFAGILTLLAEAFL